MTQHRPTGITIIAVLMIIGGIILLFTGITPLFLGPLISIDISDYQISTLGLLITIGGLTLVGLDSQFHCFMGSFKGKKMGSYNYTHNKHNCNNICNYFSCK